MLKNFIILESRLNGIFVTQYTYACSHSTWRGKLRKLAEVAKIEKKSPYVSSRSLKVIKFVTNRKGICDFLLVINSKVGRISHSFVARATYWSKLVSGTYPCHFVPSQVRILLPVSKDQIYVH